MCQTPRQGSSPGISSGPRQNRNEAQAVFLGHQRLEHILREKVYLHYPIVLGYYVCMKCPIHHVALICYCPACRGSVTSKSKAKASRENGKLGGRPKGSKNKPKSKSRKQREG